MAFFNWNRNGKKDCCDYVLYVILSIMLIIFIGGIINSCSEPSNDNYSYTSYYTPMTTVEETPRVTVKETPRTTQRKKETSKPYKNTYNPRDYSDPEDFYEDYYDDFSDYEDAEDEWMDWQ